MSVFVQPALQPAPSVHPVPPTPASQLLPASAVSAANSCQPTPAGQLLHPAPASQLLQSYCKASHLLQGQAQTHLCARFARADGGAAAVALHPADDGIAHPVAVWVYGF